MTRCVVCGTPDPVTTVTRDRLPAMQNYVYRTPERARAAAHGRLTLSVCGNCAFAWNSTFDPARLEYDSGYDNAVPSGVMAEYYDSIARYLAGKYDLARGYVVDIGCGSGTFLKALTRMYPECRGLGVDPALAQTHVTADGRVRLVKGVFSEPLLERAPSIFICRHVLEHIPAPVSFVRELRDAVGPHAGVPLFVEVPDLGWIVRHEASWDFCYEHCNYFTDASLADVLRRGGFAPSATRVGYGDQYRWMEAIASEPSGATIAATTDPVQPLAQYARGEQAGIDEARHRLAAVKAAGQDVAVWGMATKGVMFSLLVDPEGTLIDYAVDINANKQGCFVPMTGRPIEAPSALQRAGTRPLTVVVMNTNYLAEIDQSCRAMGVSATFLSASGAEV